MATYLIAVEEQNLDLIEFLNDGVRPLIEDKKTVFVCQINSPREITAKIEFEDDIYDEKGFYKNPAYADFVHVTSA